MPAQSKGRRNKPPGLPPTAVGTMPPAGGRTPSITRRVVCVTGGPDSGKTILALHLAAAWAALRERSVAVVDVSGGAALPETTATELERRGIAFRSLTGGPGGEPDPTPARLARVLLELQEEHDLFLDVDPDHDHAPLAFAAGRLAFWTLSPEDSQLRHLAETAGSLGALFALLSAENCMVVVNQTGREGSLPLEEVSRRLSREGFKTRCLLPPGSPKLLELVAAGSPGSAWARSLEPLLDRIRAAQGPAVPEARPSAAVSVPGHPPTAAVFPPTPGSEEQIAIALGKTLGVPYASRENKILRPEKGLAAVIGERFARANLVLPLFVDKGPVDLLAVALADPADALLLERIKQESGFVSVQAFIATATQLRAAIEEYYG